MNNIEIQRLDNLDMISYVNPNFIFNRFDIIYGNDYDIWLIDDESKKWYIPVHIDCKKNCIYIGIYLTPLSKPSFKMFISNILRHYENIRRIYINNALVPSVFLSNTNSYLIQLPDNKSALDGITSKKFRKHIRQYHNKLIDTFGIYNISKYDINEITDEMVAKYFEYKGQLFNLNSEYNNKNYILNYHVTNCYTIEFENLIQAVLFTCDTDENRFLENFSYNPVYAKYSLGTILYHYMIEDSIECDYKKILLGGGDYDYKKRYGSHNYNTFNGYIPIKITEKYIVLIYRVIIRIVKSNDKLYNMIANSKHLHILHGITSIFL